MIPSKNHRDPQGDLFKIDPIASSTGGAPSSALAAKSTGNGSTKSLAKCTVRMLVGQARPAVFLSRCTT